MSDSNNFRSAKSSQSETAPLMVPAMPRATIDIRKMREDYYKEQQTEEKIPKLDMLPDNMLRVNEFFVFRASPRYISLAKSVQKQYVDQARDPLFLLEKVFGNFNEQITGDLQRKLDQLSSKSYKVNGRIVNSIKYRDVVVSYRPFETPVPVNTVRLTEQWALRGPKEFIEEFDRQVQDRKNLTNGFVEDDRRRVLRYLAKISEMSEPEKVELEVSRMANSFKIAIPTEFSIVDIPNINSDLLQLLRVREYTELKNILNNDNGILMEFYPELVYRINEKANALQISKSTFKETKIIEYYESYEYEPPPLDHKMDVYARMEKVEELARMRRKPFLTPAGAIQRAQDIKQYGKIHQIKIGGSKVYVKEPPQGMQIFDQELTVYNIDNVPVSDSLRKIVVGHIDGVNIEPVFYKAYGNNIREYIYHIAEISSNLGDDLSLKTRILNGDITHDQLVNLPREQIWPEVFSNKDITARDKGRLNRKMDDKTAEEGNFILQIWQPSVKKEWFPVSIAPNPVRPENFNVVGKTCDLNKIYVMTGEGIKCLDKTEIKNNFDKYGPYNRKDLLEIL